MNEEEKEAIEFMNNIEYKQVYSDEFYDNRDILINLIEKQQKEIEELNKENTRQQELIVNIHQKWKDKILAIFKKYGLDEKEYFFSSTSDIIKFVKDMRKLMGIGDE